MRITVYGPGCPKCKQLEEIAREAVRQAGVEAEVEKVADFVEIAKAGILATPGLAVNGVVKSKGRLPKVEEIVSWIMEAQATSEGA